MSTMFLTSLFQNFFSRFYGHRHKNDVVEKIQNIHKTAEMQREIILNEAALAIAEHEAEANRAFETLYQEKKIEANLQHEALNVKSLEIEQALASLQTHAVVLAQTSESITQNTNQISQLSTEIDTIQKTRENALEARAACNRFEVLQEIKDELVQTHTLDLSRSSFERFNHLKQQAHQHAKKTLESVYYRYQPRFVWPKTSFLVNTNNKSIIDKYFAPESPILTMLLEGTDSELSLLNTTKENVFTIKVANGFGVDKEIIRLTLEECLNKKILNLDKIQAIRNKHKLGIEQKVLLMGTEAAKILELQNINPEILKLIGALNFRTSHRQNQYFHSLEVAMLAGMIAHELGVDQKLAKRAGILHDIGKALDYKIEGSHAVISGDYATQYGENEHVVDTILSHHDDKILDTPHAFILKAADAMSGARPGARVDAEDGYNRRLDGISAVVDSFQNSGVTASAIMHAGREVHVYVNSKKTPYSEIDALARNIAEKLESDVEYPGQIRVTVIRRMELTEVA